MFGAFNTILLGFQLVNFSPWTQQGTNSSGIGPSNPVNSSLALLQQGSFVLAPVTWGAVLGAWLWRGRIKADWTRLGLSEDTFRLLTRMRGSGTRTSIMRALETPKDRFQLSKDLGLDWTTVDYQVGVLLKYNLVTENAAYGNVKLFALTPMGENILKALNEMQGDNGRLNAR